VPAVAVDGDPATTDLRVPRADATKTDTAATTPPQTDRCGGCSDYHEAAGILLWLTVNLRLLLARSASVRLLA
jgi:hypothetical protein